MSTKYTKEALLNMPPHHPFLAGIDSDGCVFDTMEIKQKKCFHGLIVSHWQLGPVEQYVRETAEFVNLHSKWRGSNRFASLIRVFDLLRSRPEVARTGVTVPTLHSLRTFMESGVVAGNPELARAARTTGDPELQSVLDWSVAVNELVRKTVKNIPPFPWAGKSLDKMAQSCDLVCISQTPVEALVREWEENSLTGHLRFIAGQEIGTKTEHIAMTMRGRYEPDRVIMIGDALGDLAAARQNGVHFFPVNPSAEDASWELFHREAYDRFLAGTYAGSYEKELIARFEALLPDTPPWEKIPA